MYAVGFNMSGYMPDTDPCTATNLDEAKDILQGDIQMFIDSCEEEKIEDFKQASKTVGNWTEQLIGAGITAYAHGWAFWIHAADE